MSAWRANAVVWINDKAKGCVVVGSFGFAWWEGRRVCIGSFSRYEINPVQAFYDVSGSSDVHRIDKASAPLASVLRFVRTGLPPVQGKFA